MLFFVHVLEIWQRILKPLKKSKSSEFIRMLCGVSRHGLTCSSRCIPLTLLLKPVYLEKR